MKKGFTLIELLVVISIIALLSSIVLASLNAAREKATVSAFGQSMGELQKALEVYKSDIGYYPFENSSSYDMFILASNGDYNFDEINEDPSGMQNQFFVNNWSDLESNSHKPLLPKYISKFPTPFKLGTGSGNYNEIIYAAGTNSSFTIYTNPNDTYTCGGRNIKGYVIIFTSYQYPLDTLPPMQRLMRGGSPISDTFCLTG